LGHALLAGSISRALKRDFFLARNKHFPCGCSPGLQPSWAFSVKKTPLRNSSGDASNRGNALKPGPISETKEFRANSRSRRMTLRIDLQRVMQIGRASCRER